MLKWQKQRQKRLKLMGYVFLLLATALSSYGYLYIEKAQQQEGSYMMAAVFLLMGIFCLTSTGQQQKFHNTQMKRNHNASKTDT